LHVAPTTNAKDKVRLAQAAPRGSLLPKIKYEHAKHMAEALIRGTEGGGEIAKNLLRNTLADVT